MILNIYVSSDEYNPIKLKEIAKYLSTSNDTIGEYKYSVIDIKLIDKVLKIIIRLNTKETYNVSRLKGLINNIADNYSDFIFNITDSNEETLFDIEKGEIKNINSIKLLAIETSMTADNMFKKFGGLF